MTTVTSKQKKEAIEALFNSSKDTVVGDTFKFLLWTHNKGLYSGFSKVASRHNRVKYYGFVIDLVLNVPNYCWFPYLFWWGRPTSCY